jgi:hypothetical protein
LPSLIGRNACLTGGLAPLVPLPGRQPWTRGGLRQPPDPSPKFFSLIAHSFTSRYAPVHHTVTEWHFIYDHQITLNGICLTVNPTIIHHTVTEWHFIYDHQITLNGICLTVNTTIIHDTLYSYWVTLYLRPSKVHPYTIY